MIYFITDGEYVKIGYTGGEIDKRLQAIQTGNPKKLYVHEYIEGDFNEEHILHSVFREERLIGEWFKGSKILPINKDGFIKIIDDYKESEPIIEKPKTARDLILDFLLNENIEYFLTSKNISKAIGMERQTVSKCLSSDFDLRDSVNSINVYNFKTDSYADFVSKRNESTIEDSINYLKSKGEKTSQRAIARHSGLHYNTVYSVFKKRGLS